MGRRDRGRGPRPGPRGRPPRVSFMIHVRHAAAAIASGLCYTVLSRMARAAAPASAAAAMSWHRPVLPAALWANGAADFVHDPGAAVHEDLRPNARAVGNGLGPAARYGNKPARHLHDTDRVEDVLIPRIIAYPFVARTPYPGIRFLRLSRLDGGWGMAGMGHEERFPLPMPNGRYRFRKRSLCSQRTGHVGFWVRFLAVKYS